MIVATVLKSGGEYNESHVAKLKAMVDKHVPHDLFVCLTDMKPDCRIIELQHGWPGWWSKIELFKLCGPVLYFDLDTIILKNMADILRIIRGKKFVILRDFYRGFQNPKAMQSSVMYWEGDMSPIYTGFKWRYADPLRVPEDIHGDQKYLERVVNNAEFWQDFTSGIVSYKCDVLTRGASGKDVCIVFHGKPRPWQQKIISY